MNERSATGVENIGNPSRDPAASDPISWVTIEACRKGGSCEKKQPDYPKSISPHASHIVDTEHERIARLARWCARLGYSVEAMADVLETTPDVAGDQYKNRDRAMAMRMLMRRLLVGHEGHLQF